MDWDYLAGFDDWGDWLEQRIEQRLRQLGTRTPRCSAPGCDETQPFALTGVDPNILCYEHLADQLGRSWLEDHHVSGRHNDPYTAATPANDHGFASELQLRWDRDTLRNPDGSPLRRAAAAVRGWLDLLRLILERAVAWVPGFLEALDCWLTETLGPRWWLEFETWRGSQ